MKKLLPITAIAALAGLSAGCATTQGGEDLQAQLQQAQQTAAQALEVANQAQMTANEAQETANRALRVANGAQSTANRALEQSERTDEKVDRMFKQSMYK